MPTEYYTELATVRRMFNMGLLTESEVYHRIADWILRWKNSEI